MIWQIDFRAIYCTHSVPAVLLYFKIVIKLCNGSILQRSERFPLFLLILIVENFLNFFAFSY